MYKNQCQSNIQQKKNKQLMSPFVKEDSKSDSKNDESNLMISTLEAMKKANKEG